MLKFRDIAFAHKHYHLLFPLVLWGKYFAFYLLMFVFSVLLHEAMLTF